MGRIAEALKRAEQERAWHLGTETPETLGSTPHPAGEDAGDDGLPGAGEAECDAVAAAPEPPRAFITSAAPISPESIHRSVVALHEPACRVAERFRSVRTRLLTSNPKGSSRLYAVTSSAPREGRTVTAANLAFSLAELRHLRVALIDLDFRQRGLDRLLGAVDRPGVAEMVRGEHRLAETCIPLVRPNLHFVPAGCLGNATPSELLSGRRMRALFREIGERFHYGLIDTPAIDSVADIGLIAPLCHSALFVIRMNHTPEPLVRHCVRMLQANGVPIAGSILAGRCDETTGDEGAEYHYQTAYQAAGGEA
jgi:Mrp family chromosome partitioning ATPase